MREHPSNPATTVAEPADPDKLRELLSRSRNAIRALVAALQGRGQVADVIPAAMLLTAEISAALDEPEVRS